MAQLIWSPDSLREIADVCDAAARSSAAYARAVVEEARAIAQSLPALPRLGAVVPEYGLDDVREVQVRTFRLIYRLRGEDVEVVAFANVNRRLPRTPPG